MKGKKQNKALTPGLIIIAFTAALILYSLLIYTEKKLTAEEEKVSVLTAKSRIEKNEGSENWEEKTEIKSIPVSLLPQGYISSIDELTGMEAETVISSGSVITRDMVRLKDKYAKSMKDPVLVGFRAEDYYQTAGGKIKEGDRICIYVVDEEGEAKIRWSDVYVADAYDISGDEVISGDEKTLRYNVYMEKNDVEEFYEKLDAKAIRLALVLD